MSETISVQSQVSEKVFLTMRSLYRLAEFQKMDLSNFLIGQEKEIFLGRFKSLTADEVLFVARNFNSYYDQAVIDEEIARDQFFRKWEAYYRTLN